MRGAALLPAYQRIGQLYLASPRPHPPTPCCRCRCSPTAPEYRQRCACNPFDDIHVGAQPWCTQDFHQRLAALERRDGDAAGGDTPATSL